MFKTYLRRHGDGAMQSRSSGLRATEAIAEFRRLLAREDLIGEPWSAVLRDETQRRTLLFSRFDEPEQRLLPSDALDLADMWDCVSATGSADIATRRIVEARPDRG